MSVGFHVDPVSSRYRIQAQIGASGRQLVALPSSRPIEHGFVGIRTVKRISTATARQTPPVPQTRALYLIDHTARTTTKAGLPCPTDTRPAVLGRSGTPVNGRPTSRATISRPYADPNRGDLFNLIVEATANLKSDPRSVREPSPRTRRSNPITSPSSKRRRK